MPRNHSISATVDKAVLGLAESVASIVTCDCTDAEMGKALTETFRQCADFLKSNTRDSRGFSRDPANVDTAESNEDGGARERENENRFEDREEAALHEELERHVAALMAADPSLNRQEAMRHLLHSARGRRLAQHLANITGTRKDKREMSRVEKLQALAKRGGVQLVAKALLAKGDAMEISEQDFFELMKAEAAREGVSFTKYFEAPENIDIRRAWQMTKGTMVAKDSLMQQVQAGPTVSAEDSEEAYRQLMEMAERLAAQGKYRSVSQAFAAVFSDQRNAELAARAHRRPNAAHYG